MLGLKLNHAVKRGPSSKFISQLLNPLKTSIAKGSDAAMLCSQFQNVWAIETYVMNKRDFMRF